jgi:hypothetical protein
MDTVVFIHNYRKLNYLPLVFLIMQPVINKYMYFCAFYINFKINCIFFTHFYILYIYKSHFPLMEHGIKKKMFP